MSFECLGKRLLCATGAAVGALAIGAGVYAYNKLGGEVVPSERYGGQIVAEVFKAHGVEFIFCLSGGHISPILVASEKLGIKIVDVRHEASAVFAADAVSRMKGCCGVAAVTAGPGVTNTITAVKNAQMAESPVVIIGGAAPVLLQGRGALQDIDQLSIMKPITKLALRCTAVREIAPALKLAFQTAMSGVPGPVFVELPLDILYSYFEVAANAKLFERKLVRDVKGKPELISKVVVPTEGKGKSAAEFVDSRTEKQPVFLRTRPQKGIAGIVKQLYVRSLFARGMVSFDPRPLPWSVPLPSKNAVTDVASVLLKAERPVMIIQSQIMRPSSPTDGVVGSWVVPVVAALHAIGVPTFQGGMARGCLGPDSPIAVSQRRGVALRNADVVVVLGANIDFRLQYGEVFPRKGKIITVNRSYAVATQNSGPVFWTPYRAVEADPALFARQLADTMMAAPGGALEAARSRWAPHIANLKKGEADALAANAELATKPAMGHDAMAGKRLINPIALSAAVEKTLGPRGVVIGDGGDFVATLVNNIKPRGPLRWLDPGPFGTLGVGGGFAVGVKLCCPDDDVWLAWGDGSAGYTIAETDTLKRHGLGITALIGNDACWMQIWRDQVAIFGAETACPLNYSPYDTVAKGYGGDGKTICDVKAEELLPILAAARDAGMKVPYVLNALIGSTSFREGSISV